jgi:hypothetical protein
MKLGFSILSHQKPGPMLGALLKSLNTFSNKAIAIHHDFNQSEFDDSLFESSSYQLVKNHTRTYWSHVNNIHAIMETFRMLRHQECDWYITLSANCYPIKSNGYITRFLETTSSDGFIERNNVLTDHFDFYQYFRKGFNTKYLFKVPFLNSKGSFKFKVFRTSRKPEDILFNSSYIPYHGSDWFMINKKAMDYLLSNESRIDEMVAFLTNVNKGPDINVCPPEVVFQTVLGNGQDVLKLDHNNYRFIDWTNAVNWHPNTLTLKDWHFIEDSEALFARKFTWEKSSELIQLIDSKLLNID